MAVGYAAMVCLLGAVSPANAQTKVYRLGDSSRTIWRYDEETDGEGNMKDRIKYDLFELMRSVLISFLTVNLTFLFSAFVYFPFAYWFVQGEAWHFLSIEKAIRLTIYLSLFSVLVGLIWWYQKRKAR